MTTKEKELIDKEGIYSISKEVFPFLIGVYFLFYNNEMYQLINLIDGLQKEVELATVENVFNHINKTKKEIEDNICY